MTPGNSKPTSLSVRIFAGLVIGLAFGLFASASGRPWLMSVAVGVEPIGTVWMNLIRMVVIPLVVAAIVSGVASLGDFRRLGRVGSRTVAFAFGTLLLAAGFGLLVAQLIVPLAPVSAEVAASLRSAAAAGATDVTQQVGRIQGFKQFLIELVPVNPVKAAADGVLLPVIVFSVLFGAAAGSLEEKSRTAVVGLADAVVEVLIKLVGWIMFLAPIGILCLSAAVAARFGLDVLRSLAAFIVTIVVATTLFALFGYGAAARLFVRVKLGWFARAISPGTAVAFTTCSSMAALPTMLQSAVGTLRISPAVASFVVPLAATLNRPGSAIYQVAAVVFVSSLYGIHLSATLLAVAVFSSFLMTFSVASVPSATVFTTAPVLLAVGLPVESIALLLGVDRIPDMFRTGLNAVGHQTCAAVIARGEGEVIGDG